MQFKVKKIIQENIENELKNIGFDSSYAKTGALKHKFLNIKIFNLIPQQATIIKQTALSCGCDCGVHRGVLDCSISKSDAILSGSCAQLRDVALKLKKQPFSLSSLSDLIQNEISLVSESIRPKIFGILNLSEDSFSTYSKNPNEDILKMIDDGVDVIDIGAESTRPGAVDVSPKIQLNKILPVLDFLKDKNVIVSVDTRSSLVAKESVLSGASVINDVSFGNYDSKILDVAIEYNKKYVLTHSRGVPKNMDDMALYDNLIFDILNEIKTKANLILEKGLNPNNLIIDPGFGFAKNPDQNLQIMKLIDEFKNLGFKVLVGTSRKRFIQKFASCNTDEELDFITSLSSFYFAGKGIDYLRVHNVKKTKQAIDFAMSIR